MAVVGSIRAQLDADSSVLDAALKASAVRVNAFGQTMGKRLTLMDAQSKRSFVSMAGHQALYQKSMVTTSAALGRLGASTTTYLAGAISFGAVIAGVKAGLEKFGNIADKVTASGLSSDLFQTLAHEAQMAGVEMDGAGAALAAFNRNLGDLQAGRGRMLTALKAISPELAKQVESAKTTVDAFRAMSTALRNARSDAERASIAAAAFGTSGTALANAWAIGGDKIDELIAKAKELNLVIDSDLIANADELGDRFDTVATILDIKIKSALVGLAPQLVWLIERVADLAKEAERFAAALASPQDFLAWLGGGSGAQSRLRDVFRSMTANSNPEPAVHYDADGRLVQESAPGFDSVGPGLNARDLEQWFGVDLTSNTTTPAMPSGDTPPAGKPFDFRTFLDDYYRSSLEGYPAAFDKATSAAKKFSDGMANLQRNARASSLDEFLQQVLSSAEGLGISTDELDQFIATVSSEGLAAAPQKFRDIATALRRINANNILGNLQHETATLFASPADKALAETLRNTGIEAESAYGKAIAVAIRFNHAVQEGRDLVLGFAQDFRQSWQQNYLNAIEEKAKAQEQYADDMLKEAMEDGALVTQKQREEIDKLAKSMADAKYGSDNLGIAMKSMWDALKSSALNALDSIASKLLEAGINGLFSGLTGSPQFTSIFSSLLGTGPVQFAEGGYTGPSPRGKAVGVVHGGEYVFSAPAVARAGIGRLEAMHRSLKGYASGGFVRPSIASLPDMPAATRGGDVYEMTLNITGSRQDAAEIARVASETFEAKFGGRMRQYQQRGY